MRLCNPDSLIEWRKVEPPRFKKDWPGRLVQAASVPHYTPVPPACRPGHGRVRDHPAGQLSEHRV